MKLDALKPLTLLYVEDEDSIRQNAIEYLSRYCKNVIEAKNGEEAFALYQESKPDIIISDINMPKMDGLSLAKRIREVDTETPIIIVTAHTQTEYLLKAVELKLVKYIVKPMSSEKLHEALSMACDAIDANTNNVTLLSSSTLYDTLNRTLLTNNKPLKLTHNELLFFDFLINNRQRAITYEEIESIIWAYEGMSMDALRSLVRGLRKKLDKDYIENVSGIGYRLKTYS